MSAPVPTPFKPRNFSRKKVCRFCSDKIPYVDYKDFNRISSYVSERGKIVPARISGCCAKHQRQLTRAIKINRNIALLPYTAQPLHAF